MLKLVIDSEVNEDVRVLSARALRRFEQLEKAALAWLVLAQDKEIDQRYRCLAIEELGELEETNRLLTLALDEGIDEWVRVEAAEALDRSGSKNEAAQAWLDLPSYGEVDEWKYVEAAEELDDVESLLVLVFDNEIDPLVRFRAAEALNEHGWTEEIIQRVLLWGHLNSI
ncbi:hypothetical protein ACFL6S_26990 [Candidatus Poribacteria bacterium]